MVHDYTARVTPEERAELEQWLGVRRKINVRPSPHLVAVSVFWKNTRSSLPELPPITRELLMNAAAEGLAERYDPWTYYIEPVLKAAERLRISHPLVTVRVYLAADLDFLIPDFTDAGCEVYLMMSSSLRHNPGAMWRFLAFAEKNRLVTCSDSDRLRDIETDIARTEEIRKTGQQFWRVPLLIDQQNGRVRYRPILAGQCGSTKSMAPVRRLMEALIWHTRRGSIRTTAEGAGCGQMGITGTEWPDYCFDEWFLLAALYPRLAGRPILTLVEAGMRSRYLALDIEYVTWGNANSEMAYYGSESASGCCGPVAPAGPPKPISVRPGCTVVLRQQAGAGVPDPARWKDTPLIEADPAAESVPGALAGQVKTPWLAIVDASASPAPSGAELFLDRHLEDCDVAVTGWAFAEVTDELAELAAAEGGDTSRWQPGKVIRFPKLQGKLVLWRSHFAREFAAASGKQSASRPEILLQLWSETGRARIREASCRKQGWN
jgi:hypothetical protein